MRRVIDIDMSKVKKRPFKTGPVPKKPEPKIESSLGTADTSKLDELAVKVWCEAKFLIHLQDQRLSETERSMILAIGFRLYGARAVQ